METHIEAFLVSCRAAGLAPLTLRWYAANLRVYAEFCTAHDWRAVETPRLFIASLQSREARYTAHRFRERVEGGLSVATIRGYVRTLKRFYRWCCDEELLTVDPSARLKMPKAPKRVPRGISMLDFKRLLAVASVRDRAVLLVLADTGCRVSELCGMRERGLNLKDGIVLVRGKGNQERFVFLTPPTCEAIRAWFSLRPASEYLFVGQRGEQFKPGTVSLILRRLRKKAGIVGRCNPHSFRHAFAREYLLHNGDLASLSDLMGHRDIETTKIYSTFSMEDLKRKHSEHSAVAALKMTD